MMNDKILSETKIIDLSADYRIKDVATYESGMESSIRVHNILKKQCTGFVRSTEKM